MDTAWLNDLNANNNPLVEHPHSFTGEDPILRAILPDDPVVYVDIGAAEPQEWNNTWQFYEAGGHGLLIEPLAQQLGPLLRQRPRDRVWPTAIGAEAGTGDFRMLRNYSTFDPEWNIEEEGRQKVEIMTLASVLELFQDIRRDCVLCDIDVEGWEGEVLKGIDWDTFCPLVFCIENVEHHPDHRGKEIEYRWQHLILGQGYSEAARTPGNIIYVQDGFAAEAKEQLDAANCKIDWRT